MKPTVYQYPACSTCRKALKWLDAKGVAYDAVHIVDKPPSEKLLKKALAAGVPLKKLFNTSGESYKAGNFKDKLPNMTEAEALKALATDGKLIKRPFVVRGELVLTGFDEAVWKSTF
jgi:Spx/MgsR family transcriptional regulator